MNTLLFVLIVQNLQFVMDSAKFTIRHAIVLLMLIAASAEV
jgi:hypothetical protein